MEDAAHPKSVANLLAMTRTYPIIDTNSNIHAKGQFKEMITLKQYSKICPSTWPRVKTDQKIVTGSDSHYIFVRREHFKRVSINPQMSVVETIERN